MRKIVALLLSLVLLASVAAVPVFASAADEPLTVTVFCGDPRDQPTSDNKIFQMIEEEFGRHEQRAQEDTADVLIEIFLFGISAAKGTADPGGLT